LIGFTAKEYFKLNLFSNRVGFIWQQLESLESISKSGWLALLVAFKIYWIYFLSSTQPFCRFSAWKQAL